MDDPTIMDWAAKEGRLDKVIDFHQNHYSCTTEAMDGAATNGHLVVVEWLQLNRSEGCTTEATGGCL